METTITRLYTQKNHLTELCIRGKLFEKDIESENKEEEEDNKKRRFGRQRQ